MPRRFRLLTDEHFPTSVIEFLRNRMRPGHFLRQLEALELEENPFASGIRHIQPE